MCSMDRASGAASCAVEVGSGLVGVVVSGVVAVSVGGCNAVLVPGPM